MFLISTQIIFIHIYQVSFNFCCLYEHKYIHFGLKVELIQSNQFIFALPRAEYLYIIKNIINNIKNVFS